MKYIILSLMALCCLMGDLCAKQQYWVTKNQILLTNEGIFVDYNGNLTQAQDIEYIGGYYSVSFDNPQLAGNCSQCGSRRGPDGKCENPACKNSGRNGPKEKD